MTAENVVLRRGEIWYVDFDPARGSEQAGRRPALIIQNDAGNESARYPNTIVLAMSTKGRPVPFHVTDHRLLSHWNELLPLIDSA